ncbi:MAG: Ig-like domain-containing protein [Fibrobacteria bacterium]
MSFFQSPQVLGLLLLTGAAVAPMAQVNVKINFEPASYATPAGYLKDAGAPYNATTNRGWVTQASLSTATHAPLDLQLNTRDRAISGIDARLNTLIHMQYPTGTAGNTTPGAYEYAVPNGTYKVVVSVGDRLYDSQHYINVEGVSVISNFVGKSGTQFKQDSTVVSVTDGRITVDAIGGANTKLNYIHISTAGAPPEPAPVDLKINFQDSPPTPPAGYLKDYGQGYGLRTSANQGTGLSYGWVAPGTATPATLTALGRSRTTPSDRRLATFMHMQQSPAGSWEIAVPNGYYTVTVSMGDATTLDSRHRLAIEGQPAITDFVPTTVNRFFTAAQVVQVADGRLTLNAAGGTNSKLNYVTLKSTTAPAGRPSIGGVAPASGSVNVLRDAAISAEVNLVAGPINPATVTSATARILRSNDNVVMPSTANTSGGGDVVVIQPTTPLAATTGYRYEFSDGLQDVDGKPFLPATGHFTTGSTLTPPSTQVFDPIALGSAASGYNFTTLAIGPDAKLYAGTLSGEILRFPLNADGTLGARQLITSVISDNGGVGQAIIGMVFDPAATSANPVLWITANHRTLTGAPDWSGKIVRLSGANLETVVNYVVGLPRAVRDHMSNSLAWGPDGALYLSQGSRSANGAYDNAWRSDERLLNAAVLRIDPAAIPVPPLNVKTEEGGTYNPYAPGAPVTLFATGIRNAYDLVWHSNGSLYVSGNGSAAGGNSPATPSPLPAACQDRFDKAIFGAYTGPSVPAIVNNATAQVDMLYRAEAGKYYGHPNPRRCEWVLNGGNPTSGVDLLEEPQYPVGTMPDRNWTPPAFDYGEHFSPNGIIEYKNNRFSGSLQGKMLVVRYSGGKDILVLTVNPTTKAISASEVLNTNGIKFGDPLDLVENTANGYLYLAEYAAMKLTLLRPR